jgi:hypothetical protein
MSSTARDARHATRRAEQHRKIVEDAVAEVLALTLVSARWSAGG